MGRHLCTEQLRLSSTSQQDHRYQKMSIIGATHIQDRELSITAQPHREGHRCLHLDWFSAAAAPTRTQAINPSVLMTRSDSIRWPFRLTLGWWPCDPVGTMHNCKILSHHATLLAQAYKRAKVGRATENGSDSPCPMALSFPNACHETFTTGEEGTKALLAHQQAPLVGSD